MSGEVESITRAGEQRLSPVVVEGDPLQIEEQQLRIDLGLSRLGRASQGSSGAGGCPTNGA